MIKNKLISLISLTTLIFIPFLANANVCLENTNSFGFSFIGQYQGHLTAELKPGYTTTIKYKKGMVIALFRVEFGSWIYIADLSPAEDGVRYQIWSILGNTSWKEIPNAC